MRHPVAIKSFNGIGDLLFVTPTLRMLHTHHRVFITVLTHQPDLLRGNPYVDYVSGDRPRQTHRTDEEGVFLGYPDPIHRRMPTQHHILTDWEIVTRHFGLETPPPAIKPEIYLNVPPEKKDVVGVQVLHKNTFNRKKQWPHCDELAALPGFEPIPRAPSLRALVKSISEYKAVVCCEGGIHHIAKAVRTPAIVIYGGFQRPEWTGYEDQTNLVSEIWCRDECFNPDPCVHQTERACLWQISISDVWKEVEKLT